MCSHKDILKSNYAVCRDFSYCSRERNVSHVLCVGGSLQSACKILTANRLAACAFKFETNTQKPRNQRNKNINKIGPIVSVAFDSGGRRVFSTAT